MCAWWQVKLCDPLVTHGPYVSALEVRHDEALYKSTFTLLTYTCLFERQLVLTITNDSELTRFYDIHALRPLQRVLCHVIEYNIRLRYPDGCSSTCWSDSDPEPDICYIPNRLTSVAYELIPLRRFEPATTKPS